jgi:hypothetical protein
VVAGNRRTRQERLRSLAISRAQRRLGTPRDAIGDATPNGLLLVAPERHRDDDRAP